MKLRKIVMCTLAALCFSAPALADVQGDLNGFFGSLGYDGNVSKDRAERAGYRKAQP